jgi:hypothetical protein
MQQYYLRFVCPISVQILYLYINQQMQNKINEFFDP